MPKNRTINDYSAVSVLMGIDYLHAKGLDAEQWLDDAGIHTSALHEPNARISEAVHTQVWNILMEKSQDEALGLNIGINLRTLSTNILSLIAANSKSYGDALENICQFHGLMGKDPQPYIQDVDDIGTAFCQPPLNDVPLIVQQSTECMFAAIISLSRHMMRYHVSPSKIHFTHDEPAYHETMKDFFSASIQYNQECNRLIFTKNDVESPIPYADPQFLNIIAQHAKSILNSLHQPESWDENVEQILLKNISQGNIDVGSVANGLEVSTRTLQQNLKKEGTNFTAILEKVRKEIALDHLKQGKSSVVNLALSLGFSEQSSFNHAFKRWTGKTPTAYQQQWNAKKDNSQ